jgi:hypothetical protein
VDTGTAIIKENNGGTPIAFTSSTGSKTAWYLNTFGSYLANRMVKCDIKATGFNTPAVAVVLTALAAVSPKYFYRIQVNQVGANDSFVEEFGYGGAPLTNALGTIAGAGSWHTVIIRRWGRNIEVDIDSGTITHSRTLAGSIGNPTDDPGLFVECPIFGFGVSGEWDSFECRNWAYS